MITKKQKAVLDFIKSYHNKKEYSPSLEEIQKKFKHASVSTAHHYVKKLQDGGYIKKDEHLPRAIDVYETEQMIQIPLLGSIVAGQPIEAIEDKETIAVSQNKLPFPSEKIYALRITGDSMIDENIHNGDIVLVKQQNTAENGQKVVALIDNHEATLKKFYKERGHIRLQPANKNMEPIIIRRDRDFAIQGVVLDVVRREAPFSISLSEVKTEKKRDKKLPLNKIICGDAVEIMEKIPSDSIDLVVTSPPYDKLRDYKTYVFDFESMAKGLFKVIKKGGVLVWVVGDKINKGNKSLTSFRQALFFQSIGFNVHDIMIYRKKNTPFMRSNAYTNCHEFMFVFSKGSPRTFNPLKTKTVRQGKEMLPFNKKADGVNKKTLAELKPKKTLTNIWDYAVGLHGSTSDKIAFQHTAIFPEKLAEDHILSWTKKGDVVFDPMCGSGTTCKMAAINKRFYVGCDISKEYVELTKKRLRQCNL